MPPGVVTPIVPVTAPDGTVAVTCVSEFTVNVVAANPPNVTCVVCERLTPLMATTVPTGPWSGLKPWILGGTRKLVLLVSVPPGVVTRTGPVRAPAGTLVVICVPETTVNAAATPSKLTAVAPVRLRPVIVTFLPTMADVGFRATAIPNLNSVPQDGRHRAMLLYPEVVP